MKASLLVPALLMLSACVPPTTNRPAAPMTAVVAPSSDDILWRRKDGQMMTGNPALYEKGTRDRSTCEAEASASGQLDFPIFASCMDRAGYIQMRKAS